jgi:hypothetical protein
MLGRQEKPGLANDKTVIARSWKVYALVVKLPHPVLAGLNEHRHNKPNQLKT